MKIFEGSPLIVFHDMDKTPLGTKLTELPQHIAVVPWFYPGQESERAVVKKITGITIAKVNSPFVFITGSQVTFGLEDIEPATRVLSENNAIEELHLVLVRALGSSGCKFVDLTFAKSNYSPHITHKVDGDKPYGAYKFDSLTVGRKNKDKSTEILTVIEL